MNGWQPIKSAPHEELVVLGWWEAFPVSSVPDPDFVWKQEIGFASSGQRFANGYSNRWEHGQATHWMPLAPPPDESCP